MKRLRAGMLTVMAVLAMGTTAVAQDTPPVIAPPPPPVAKPIDVTVSAPMAVKGTVAYKDVEFGYYAVGDWALRGDKQADGWTTAAGVQSFKDLVGQEVLVYGTPFDGVSTRMVQQLVVSWVGRAITKSNRDVPAAVSVNGRPVSFDQAPVVVDGTLMVPLRAVAEAAGGTVTWNADKNSVDVLLADRFCQFTVGQGDAELNMRGVFYIKRNLQALSKAPVIVGGRTMIPLDAASKFLGLYELVGGAQGSLDLVNGK